MGGPTPMADKESTTKKPALARTVKDKWRSKRLYKLRAPGIFQHVDLGETVATEPEQLAGRTIEVTLSELGGGGDVSKAHIKLRFQIERISGENVAETRFIGHDLTSDYVRRSLSARSIATAGRATAAVGAASPAHCDGALRLAGNQAA